MIWIILWMDKLYLFDLAGLFWWGLAIYCCSSLVNFMIWVYFYICSSLYWSFAKCIISVNQISKLPINSSNKLSHFLTNPPTSHPAPPPDPSPSESCYTWPAGHSEYKFVSNQCYTYFPSPQNSTHNIYSHPQSPQCPPLKGMSVCWSISPSPGSWTPMTPQAVMTTPPFHWTLSRRSSFMYVCKILTRHRIYTVCSDSKMSTVDCTMVKSSHMFFPLLLF